MKSDRKIVMMNEERGKAKRNQLHRNSAAKFSSVEAFSFSTGVRLQKESEDKPTSGLKKILKSAYRQHEMLGNNFKIFFVVQHI